MPKINFHGIALSDVIMLILLLLTFKAKVVFTSFEKKYFRLLFYFISFYIFEEIIHFKINIDLAGIYLFVMDRIAFIYFFILSYVIIFYSHLIKKELIAKYLKISIYLNAIVLPYIFILIYLGTYNKLSSLFVKPNQLAFFLIISPIILLIANYLKLRKFNFKQVNNFILFLYIPMFATASKAGIVSLLMIHFIIFLYSLREFNFLIRTFYLIAFLLGILAFNPFNLENFLYELTSYFPQFSRVVTFLFSDTLHTTDSFRKINNINGINMFMQYPIFGIGFGTDDFLSPTGHEIHNSYIRLLACLGIFGTVLFIVFNLYFIIISKKVLKTYIFILLFLIVFLFGWYHDIFTNKFYYFVFSYLIMTMSFKLKSRK